MCGLGFAGSACQYSDSVTCNGRGSAQADGSCVCSAGAAGIACQYSDVTTCNGLGSAQADGSCVCGSGFESFVVEATGDDRDLVRLDGIDEAVFFVDSA